MNLMHTVRFSDVKIINFTFIKHSVRKTDDFCQISKRPLGVIWVWREKLKWGLSLMLMEKNSMVVTTMRICNFIFGAFFEILKILDRKNGFKYAWAPYLNVSSDRLKQKNITKYDIHLSNLDSHRYGIFSTICLEFSWNMFCV